MAPETQAAVEAWLAVKEKLRRRMTRAEWDLAVREIRMLRVLGQRTIVLGLPPNGRRIYKFEGRRSLLVSLVNQAGWVPVFTVYPESAEQLPNGWSFLDPEPPPAKLGALLHERRAITRKIRELKGREQSQRRMHYGRNSSQPSQSVIAKTD